MRHDPTPLHSAREREQLLSATQLLAILLLALALTLVGAHALTTTDRGWQWFGVAIVGAIGLCALHAYLVRCSQTAFHWSLIALGCLSTALLAVAGSANTAPAAGSLSLAALVTMLFSNCLISSRTWAVVPGRQTGGFGRSHHLQQRLLPPLPGLGRDHGFGQREPGADRVRGRLLLRHVGERPAHLLQADRAVAGGVRVA